MSTLHVTDAHRAPWAVLHALGVLVSQPDHRVLLIGNSSDAKRARGAGLPGFHRVQAHGNRPVNALRTIREAISTSGADCVHAWDTTSRDVLRRAGASNMNTTIPPEIERAFPEASVDRGRTRAAWGLDENTRVILPSNDHPRDVDAMRLAYIAGILSVAGTPTVSIAPSRARNLNRAARFTWRHDRSRWLIIDDRSPLLLRGAGDAVWWQATSPRDTGLTVRMLIESGLPGAADRAEQTMGLPEDRMVLCEPSHELAPTTALGRPLARYDASPDHVGFFAAVESLVTTGTSLAAR